MITSEKKAVELICAVVGKKSAETYQRVFNFSESRLERSTAVVNEYIASAGLPSEKLCVIAVGSVGRREALEASDLDVIPVLKEEIPSFHEHDQQMRQLLRERLGVKVSKGEDLTKFILLSDLAQSETIGAEGDDSAALTKRILILSESAQAGGGYGITSVRDALLSAYADQERTSGRHVLSLCNDIARYYRTLCIEYKSKVDNEDDSDWCTRNIKLRHCRKFWYYATMLALSSTGVDMDEKSHRAAVSRALELPPYARLITAVPEGGRSALRQLLESYAWFLEFLGVSKNREALRTIEHEDRYQPSLANPFPALKFNSDLIHREMIGVLEGLDRSMRHRVLDWFLL